jgi:hypothetical protein
MGMPGKVVRETTADQRAANLHSAELYRSRMRAYREKCSEIG